MDSISLIVKFIFCRVEEGTEGFLDNGPPGFAVYGPPQEQDNGRLAIDEVTLK